TSYCSTETRRILPTSGGLMASSIALPWRRSSSEAKRVAMTIRPFARSPRTMILVAGRSSGASMELISPATAAIAASSASNVTTRAYSGIRSSFGGGWGGLGWSLIPGPVRPDVRSVGWGWLHVVCLEFGLAARRSASGRVDRHVGASVPLPPGRRRPGTCLFRQLSGVRDAVCDRLGVDVRGDAVPVAVACAELDLPHNAWGAFDVDRLSPLGQVRQRADHAPAG